LFLHICVRFALSHLFSGGVCLGLLAIACVYLLVNIAMAYQVALS
jgi:hypothetical protein